MSDPNKSERPIIQCPNCRLVHYLRANGCCPKCGSTSAITASQTAEEPAPIIEAPPPDPIEASLAGFGAAVRRWRMQRHLTQSQFAALLGINRTTVSHFEAIRRNISMRTVLRLAVALRVDPALLINWPPAHPNACKSVVNGPSGPKSQVPGREKE